MRRLLAEARGEALDRLAALSARLLGAAHAQIALIAEAPAVIAPATPGGPQGGALIVRAFEPRARSRSPTSSATASRLPRRPDRSRRSARRRAVRLRRRTAPVDAPRHRDIARAGAHGRGGARARRAGRVERPARPGLRGGEYRQLRLEPRHRRAALGRPADGALRPRARDLRPTHRLVLGPPAPGRPRQDRGGDQPRDRVAAAITRPTIASCTPTARCAGSRPAAGC